jgi:hypothetical protein
VARHASERGVRPHHKQCISSWFERAASLINFRPNQLFGEAQEAMNGKRVWYPFTFTDRNAQVYRVSFLLAEEATWDHRFHDLEGREIDVARLDLTLADLSSIQTSCDGAVGSANAHLDVGRHIHAAPDAAVQSAA